MSKIYIQMSRQSSKIEKITDGIDTQLAKLQEVLNVDFKNITETYDNVIAVNNAIDYLTVANMALKDIDN